MEHLVLVAYATKYGSTEESTRVVGEVLQNVGFTVEMSAVNDVTAWKPYSAVVLAAALYMGRLHKDARRFVARWQVELGRIPVALMVPGPVNAEEKDKKGAEQQLKKELARIPWFHPIETRVIGGKWDPANLTGLFRWMLRKIPASDARNWEAIREWARDLAGKIEPALTR
jgi:menaquinone-dependent protoporphyrinogen oxidase